MYEEKLNIYLPSLDRKVLKVIDLLQSSSIWNEITHKKVWYNEETRRKKKWRSIQTKDEKLSWTF